MVSVVERVMLSLLYDLLQRLVTHVALGIGTSRGCTTGVE